MDITKDFRKYALSKGISSTMIDDSAKSQLSNAITTPYILEERQLNVATYDIFSRLLLDRIVFLSGEVSRESMDTIVAQLLYLDSVDKRDVSIYINSPGGDIYSGLELISVMDYIKSTVSTTVLGLAASMGAVIAASGEKGKRYALPYSRYMIHQPLSDFGYSKYTDSKIALEEMENARQDLYGILSQKSGNDFDTIVNLCEHGDKWLKPQQAIELGFIDDIIVKKS